jgi:hypothetical protein
MARKLHNLPPGQVGENLLAYLADLFVELGDLLPEILVDPVVDPSQLLQAIFQIEDRLLEIEVLENHPCSFIGNP